MTPARRLRRALVVIALLGLTFAAVPASAHVEVLPATVQVGVATELTLRVPSEMDLPVTKLEFGFPEGLEVFAFESTPGWRRRVLNTEDGRVRGVIFLDGAINAQEFADFRVLATPTAEGPLVITAMQTYQDGDVQRWVLPPGPNGEPPQEGPEAGKPGAAPVLTVAPAGTPTTTTGATPPTAPAAESDDGSSAGVWLGLIAIGIAALAALGVGLLWSTRPATLPEDPPEE